MKYAWEVKEGDMPLFSSLHGLVMLDSIWAFEVLGVGEDFENVFTLCFFFLCFLSPSFHYHLLMLCLLFQYCDNDSNRNRDSEKK